MNARRLHTVVRNLISWRRMPWGPGRLAAVFLLFALLPGAATAQSFEDYLALVDRYAVTPEAASLTLSRWAVPAEQIRGHVGACLPRTSGFAGQLSPCSGIRWGRAVMLHSEAAQTLIDTQPGLAAFHIDMARRLLPALGERPQLVLAWYRFMVMLNLSRGRVTLAMDLAAVAADRFPKVADGFVLRGLVREGGLMFDAQNLRDLRSDDRRPPGAVGYGLSVRSFRAVEKPLLAAAADFRQALAIAPQLVEAQLHLARIQVLLDDNRGPTVLKAIADTAPDPASRYLAHMFLGDAAERANRWPDAAAAYRAARATDARHQSACAALSYLAGRTPGEDAVALASECVDLDASHDPWWAYRTSAEDPALLEWLRMEVRKE